MAKHDIFISYSRQDREIVDKICKELDANDISFFRDIFDIAISNVFPQTLAEGILSSKLVLFIASKNSFASNYTSKEVTFAYQNRIAILPLLIDESEMPTRYSFMFSDVQCMSLVNTTMPRLIADIKGLLMNMEQGEQNKATKESTKITTHKDTPKKSGRRGVSAALITLFIIMILALGGVGAYLLMENKPAKTEVINSIDGYYHITGSRKLTYNDIQGLSTSELRIMRNEIYARHGYIFQDDMLRNYFSQKEWYAPKTKNVSLSSIEQYNVLFIKGYEQQ